MFTSDVYVYDGVKLELHGDSGTTVSVVSRRCAGTVPATFRRIKTAAA